MTDAGDCIMIARFATEEAARRNSDRPEQGAWWAETEACFDGPVRFHESTDVNVMRHGDADQARFVQVMEGHVSDRERARRLDEEADEILATARPDLIESITAYYDDGAYTDVAVLPLRGGSTGRRAAARCPTDMAPDVRRVGGHHEGRPLPRHPRSLVDARPDRDRQRYCVAVTMPPRMSISPPSSHQLLDAPGSTRST